VFRELGQLRQPRYAALAVGMVILAGGCVGAGTWQIFRYQQSVHGNHALRANAHTPAVPLTTKLVPLTSAGPAPARNAVLFRTVTVTGSYLPAPPQYLLGDSVAGLDGYDVISPFHTDAGVLLVARGFASGNSGASPSNVPSPPAGRIQIVGRLQTVSTADDGATELPGRQLQTINPTQQAGRLGLPVYQTYLILDAGRPGTAGLIALPGPDLSNPVGGAFEGQHLAYVVQWYLFALLALAAPFIFRRHEIREAQLQYLGIDPGAVEIDEEMPVAADVVRRQLTAGSRGVDGADDTALAVRAAGELQPYRTVDPDRLRRARRLADRYGRSLGEAYDGPVEADPPGRPRVAAVGAVGERPLSATRNPDSTVAVHSSEGDELHGAYNDYLWELALRDGNLPEVSVPEPADAGGGDAAPRPEILDGPTTISTEQREHDR
jgi:cytochrome oxidase assembly protein ShyY1